MPASFGARRVVASSVWPRRGSSAKHHHRRMAAIRAFGLWPGGRPHFPWLCLDQLCAERPGKAGPAARSKSRQSGQRYLLAFQSVTPPALSSRKRKRRYPGIIANDELNFLAIPVGSSGLLLRRALTGRWQVFPPRCSSFRRKEQSDAYT